MSTNTKPLWRRTWVLVTAAAVIVPVVAIAWYLGSPLFLNSTVVEEFPRAAVAVVPADMTVEEVEKEMEDAEAQSVESSDPMPDETEPVKLVSGTVTGADKFHQGSGLATIYALEDGSRVLRLEKLDVTNGPDLHVILTPVANPDDREDVMTEGYVDLGKLKGNRGNQNYDIPDDFEIGDEISVVIYCAPFHVIFSTATLT
jgi:hypothetical protein